MSLAARVSKPLHLVTAFLPHIFYLHVMHKNQNIQFMSMDDHLMRAMKTNFITIIIDIQQILSTSCSVIKIIPARMILCAEEVYLHLGAGVTQCSEINKSNLFQFPHDRCCT